MTVLKFEAPGSPVNLLTTELNSLADGANKLSAAQSNDAAGELDLFADFEFLIAAQGSARSAGAFIALYILIELDGTNYTFGDDSLDPPASAWVGNFPLDATTNARYVHIRQVPLPPTDFKVLVINNTGQAFAASGNVLKYASYSYEST